MQPDDSTPKKPCTKCGVPQVLDAFKVARNLKSGRASICKACTADYQRVYRKVKPEKARAAEDRWRKANQARVNERSRRNYAKQGSAGRERKNAYLRAYRAANPEKTAAKLRAYAQRHPEQTRARCALRRARLKGSAVNDLTTQQWEAIKATYKQRCAYCGKRRPLTLDHVIPLAKGGNHTASNVVPACRPCNGRKWIKDAPPFQPLLITFEEASS